MKIRKNSPNAVNRFTALWVGLLAFTLAGAANAAFIDLSGTVTSGGVGDPTPVEPFSTGDTLTGFIEIDDAAAMPGATFDASSVLDFNVTVGPAVFSFADSTPFGFFSGMFSSDGSFLAELNVATSFGDFPGCSSCNLTLNGAQDIFVVSSTGIPFGFAEGDLMAEVRAAATVPEPSIALLFGLGMLGLGVARRSRAHG
jgi:hypothetical protein